MSLSLGSDGPLMLKEGQIERKISKSKNLRKFDLLGALEIRGYEKLRFLLQKAHPCVNPRRLSHFASKLVGGSDLQGWAGKKECQKVSDSHRNDVSLITQGLCYRAACDTSDDSLPLEASKTVTWHTVDCSSQWRCETVIVIVIMVSVTLVTVSMIVCCLSGCICE